MRLREAEMGNLIAGGVDGSAVATDLLEMRQRLSRLIIERDALMDGLVFRPEVG